MRNVELSVIIPTYNEEENVEPLFGRLSDALKGYAYEVIFVDDSTDGTPYKIRKLCVNRREVRMLHRKHRRGLSSAVVEGFDMAHGVVLCCMDGDLQHPPEAVKSMYNVMLQQNADICLPSRVSSGGMNQGLNSLRRFISWVARQIGKIMLPCLRNVSDPTSGLFMIRRSVIRNAELSTIGWKILIDILAKGTYRNIVEIPYTFEKRSAGSSKFSIGVSIDYIRQLIHLRRETGNRVKKTL